MGFFDKLFGKKQSEQSAPSKPLVQNPVSTYSPVAPVDLQPKKEPEKKEITIPQTYDDKPMAYHYSDVKVTSLGVPESKIIIENPLVFNVEVDHVEVIQDGIKIGVLPENRIAGMVRDWIRQNDPYFAYVTSYNDGAESFEIFLAFYADVVGKFLERNSDAKLVKLTGKQEDFACPIVGARCEVEFDDEKEKYYVALDGSRLGGLPATAIKYATDHDIDPEELEVIISSIDYDLDKDREIISVYVAD